MEEEGRSRVKGLFEWVLGWPGFENLARTRKDALFSCGWILARLH